MRNKNPQIAAHIQVELNDQTVKFAKKNNMTKTDVVVLALTAFLKQQKEKEGGDKCN